jgi:trehalose-6-phosphate synthase
MIVKHFQHRNWNYLFLLILSIAVSSCALIGGFNAKSHEQLTALKAAHVKLIDSFTKGKAEVFDSKKLSEDADKIDLKFREALEFSKSLDDKFRVSNEQLLKEIFEEDLANIKKKQRLLTDVEAKTLSVPSADAYDRAVKGECARPGANCK